MSNLLQWARQKEPAIYNASLSSGVAGSELNEWLTGGLSGAGVPVTEKTVMSTPAVYACVRTIAGAIASMPLPIYEKTEDARSRIDHPLWWILNKQANPMYTASTFWRSFVSSLLLHGDGFARIIRRSRRRPDPIGLEWYHKHQVQVEKNNGRLIYRLQPDEGAQIILDQDDMIHVPGPGFNGRNGMSQIRYVLRNSAGGSIAAGEYSAEFFKNGSRPDFALEYPGVVDEQKRDLIYQTWDQRHNGVKQSHRPAILAGGVKLHALTMNPEDTQLMESRRFYVEEIAMIYGVPPVLIGLHEKSTSFGKGIEEVGIHFVKYALSSHIDAIEQELNRKLLPGLIDRFIEFNADGLQRGDFKNRNEGYRIALGRAGEPQWMSVNEVRKQLNLPPIDGGDEMNQGVTNEPRGYK